MGAAMTALARIQVLDPGLLTTIQDQGRPGQLHKALSRGGAMDPDQMKIANLLVGNSGDEAGLEVTGLGPTLSFDADCCIATTGAPIVIRLIDQKKEGLVIPSHRPVLIRAGSAVRWSAPRVGFRSWIGFSGGIHSDTILGSRSGHLAAEVGPQRLTKGAVLALGSQSGERACDIMNRLKTTVGKQSILTTAWSVPPVIDHVWSVIEVPALEGRHFTLLMDEQRAQLLSQLWTVSARSNRQGLGLEGKPIQIESEPHLLSEPVREGTVQLPSAGMPFILLAEHQSTGGYPRVLEVVSAAKSLLAQAGPGSKIVFKLVNIEQAESLQKKSQGFMAVLSESIRTKLRS